MMVITISNTDRNVNFTVKYVYVKFLVIISPVLCSDTMMILIIIVTSAESEPWNSQKIGFSIYVFYDGW